MVQYPANKKTHEQFIKEFNEKGYDKNIEILGKYVNCKTKIKVQCKKCGRIWEVVPYSLLKGHGCEHCSKQNINKGRIKSGQFLNNFSKKEKSKRYDIIEYKGYKEKMKIRCKKCGKERIIAPKVLMDDSCKIWCDCQKEEKSKYISQCRKVVFSKCRPDLVKYFADSKDADLYSPYQNVNINIKCLNCGHIYTQHSEGMLKHIKDCPVCGNKISRPNRFIHALILELKEHDLIKNYKFEYTPNDTKYPYDAYILTNDGKEILIECQGRQHYLEEKVTGNIFNQKAIAERDKIKKDCAINNGYIFIEIECKNTDFEYIKNSLLKTNLKDFIDLSNIDWIKVEEIVESNLVKQVCDYYNSHEDLFIYEIANNLNLHRWTVREKLKLGAKLGWTDYNPEEKDSRKSRIQIQEHKGTTSKYNSHQVMNINT